MPLHILEAAAERQRRIGLATFQQHEIAVEQVHVELKLTGGIDPPLERWRWRAPGGDRRRECPLRGVGVGRQMDGREVEAVGHLVESGHLAVGRQERRDLQPGQGEQVPERVFVFAPREPPQPGPSTGRDPCAVGREQVRVEPAGHGRDLLPARPLEVGRRHLAGSDPVVDPHKRFQDGGIGEIAGNHCQIKAGLGRFARVACVAVPLEEGFKHGLCGRCHSTGNGGNPRADGDSKPTPHHASSPRSEPVLEENTSASTPSFWSIVTKRFARGSFLDSSKARWPGWR